MKITQLIGVKNIIMEFYHEKLPTKLAYKFMKFIKAAEQDENFYNKRIQEIVESFCEKDSDGNYVQSNGGVKISDDKKEECNKELEELNSIDVENPGITFSMDELSCLSLSIQDMMLLSDFITDK